MLENKTPPHDADLEASLVSSVAQSRDALMDAIEVLPDADMMFNAGCREIYAAELALNREGNPVELKSVIEWMSRNGRIKEAGGYGEITRILSASPTAANAGYYAKKLRDLWIARQLVYVGNDMARDAMELAGGEVSEIRNRYEQKMFSLAEVGVEQKPKTSQEVMHGVSDLVDRYADKKGIGYKTGFIDIDRVFMGFADATVTVLAGRPGGGKSKLAGNLIVNLADWGVSTMLYSLEMNNEEIGLRMACSQANVDHFKLVHGYLEEADAKRIADATRELAKMPVHWQDHPTLKPSELVAGLRRMKRRHNIQFCVIDHMLLMVTDKRYTSRNDEVGEISRGIKLAAKECEIPILALCQMNRGVEHRSDDCPKLSDLRDSGNIEQDADNVLFLHRAKDQQTGHSGTIDIYIAKQRNGPLGKATLYDRANCYRFENYAGQS